MCQVKDFDSFFYLQRNGANEWKIEMTISKISVYPSYYNEGQSIGFKGGTDIAIAVAEITDPR